MDSMEYEATLYFSDIGLTQGEVTQWKECLKRYFKEDVTVTFLTEGPGPLEVCFSAVDYFESYAILDLIIKVITSEIHMNPFTSYVLINLTMKELVSSNRIDKTGFYHSIRI